jgi:hypothetical protein
MIRISAPRKLQPDDEDCRVEVEMLSCDQVHLIEPYVTRQLRVRTQTQFELHLFACEHCLRAVEFELLVKRAVADLAKFAQFSRSWH